MKPDKLLSANTRYIGRQVLIDHKSFFPTYNLINMKKFKQTCTCLFLFLAFTFMSHVGFSQVTNTNTMMTYTTIQAAIDAPTTLGGHTITVDAGTYAESDILITKARLTIIRSWPRKYNHFT